MLARTSNSKPAKVRKEKTVPSHGTQKSWTKVRLKEGDLITWKPAGSAPVTLTVVEHYSTGLSQPRRDRPSRRSLRKDSEVRR